MDGISNHFPAKNALDCRILHIQVQKFFPGGGGDTAGLPSKRPGCLDPDTNFRLARQRSHCSWFTKRPLSPTFHTAGISKRALLARCYSSGFFGLQLTARFLICRLGINVTRMGLGWQEKHDIFLDVVTT